MDIIPKTTLKDFDNISVLYGGHVMHNILSIFIKIPTSALGDQTRNFNSHEITFTGHTVLNSCSRRCNQNMLSCNNLFWFQEVSYMRKYMKYLPVICFFFLIRRKFGNNSVWKFKDKLHSNPMKYLCNISFSVHTIS